MEQIWIYWHTFRWAWRHRQECGSFVKATQELVAFIKKVQLLMVVLEPRIARLKRRPAVPASEAEETTRVVLELVREMDRYRDYPPMGKVRRLITKGGVEAGQTWVINS